jgi:hypothetical protein
MAGNTAILSVRIIGDAAQAQKSFKTAEAAADKFGDKMGSLNKGMDLAGVGAGAALAKGFYDAVTADTGGRKLAGQLGLPPEEAKKAGELAGKIYGEAYGGSLEEVNTAISAVGSTLAKMSDNGGADVERLTKKAMDLAGTFELDLPAAVNTAGILMKSGLAKDGDEAFDLLVGSMQKMPKAMQAELLPVLDEYSKHFADLGIDGATAFGIMVNASRDGAIGMDKAGDALKEFTIRATDGSKTTTDAFKTIGVENDEMAKKLLAGGEEGAEAFAKIVGGLQAIEDPQARATAALALFGTPLEDLGTAKIPDFLNAIDPMGDAFDTMTGKADELGKTVGEGPGVAIEKFTREAQTQLQEFAAQAIPYLQPVLDWAIQYSDYLGPLAALIGVVTAAQWLWNFAMAANPIGLVIVLLAGIAAGLIWAYENVGWFRDAVDKAAIVAQVAFQLVQDKIDDVIEWLDKMLAPIGGVEGAFKLLQTAGINAMIGITAQIKDTIKWAQTAIAVLEAFDAVRNGGRSYGGGTVGNADGGSLTPLMAQPVPMMGLMSTSTAIAPLTSSVPSGTASSLGSFSGPAMPAPVNISITVKADATTDGVQLGKQLVRTINKALTAQGSPKLAIV